MASNWLECSAKYFGAKNEYYFFTLKYFTSKQINVLMLAQLFTANSMTILLNGKPP